jgi:glycerophosphoryl diester phosphodiesterase
MTNPLKYYLNPTFAIVFAVGVDRFYKVLDPLTIQGYKTTTALLTPNFYVPLTLILFTLVAGTLSAASNDMLIESNPNVSPTSWTAVLTYLSILCILVMFYFSPDFRFVSWWIIAYASLCFVNALWNYRTVTTGQKWPHVSANLTLVFLLIASFLVNLDTQFLLHSPFWPPAGLYFVLVLVVVLKTWQRKHPRSYDTATDRVTIPVLLANSSGQILNIAHRAALNPTNANTLEGISECIRLGIDGIEIDVQLTRDHELILFHDQFVLVDGKPTKVTDLSLEELNLVISKGTRQQHSITRLTEALSCVHDTETIVVLDIKTSGIADRIIKAVQKENVATRTSISSFDYITLRQMIELDSSISTILTIGFSRVSVSLFGFCWTIYALLFPINAARLARANGLLCPAYRVTRRLIRSAHQYSIAVLIWRITNTNKLKGLIELKPDGVVNDSPQLVQDKLKFDRESLIQHSGTAPRA